MSARSAPASPALAIPCSGARPHPNRRCCTNPAYYLSWRTLWSSPSRLAIFCSKWRKKWTPRLSLDPESRILPLAFQHPCGSFCSHRKIIRATAPFPQKHLNHGQYVASAESVRQYSAERREHEHWKLSAKSDDPQHERGAGNTVGNPRERHLLHPRADEGDALADEIQSEITAGEGAERIFHDRACLTFQDDQGGHAVDAAFMPLVPESIVV